MRFVLLVLLAACLCGCGDPPLTSSQQFDAAKRCVDAGMIPSPQRVAGSVFAVDCYQVTQ